MRAGSDRFSTRGQPQRTHTTRPPTSRSEAGLTGTLVELDINGRLHHDMEGGPRSQHQPGSNSPRQATATMVRTLAPQSDGTLKGTETDVTDRDSPCAAGVVIKYSITAKRIADTPKDVVADPATAPPDHGVHKNQYVAIPVSRGAALKSAFSGSGQTADYAYEIAATGASARRSVSTLPELRPCWSCSTFGYRRVRQHLRST